MLNTNGREPISNRARFASVEDGFNIQRPPLEPRAFDAERDRALDPSTPSGAILLDMRDTLMTLYPATTPLLLAKFLRIRAGEEIRVRLRRARRFTMCCRPDYQECGRYPAIRLASALAVASVDTQLAEPTIDEVHPHFTADQPLRADRKDISHNQHARRLSSTVVQ
jgi:hypothetical protein